MSNLLRKINNTYIRIVESIQKAIKKNIIIKRYNHLINKSSNVSEDDACKKIESIHKVEKISFIQNVEYNPKYDLMIVVPIYNVEKYLNKCLDSLLNQKTRYSYYIVCIDDGSTDRSGKILDSYSGQEKLHIIHQKNKGLSGARNKGLEVILGKYVLFVDSDDYMADDAVEKLLDAAINYNADLVEGGHANFIDENIASYYTHKSEGVVNNWYNITGYPWGKLIRSYFFKSICFPQGVWYEDTIMKTLICPECKKIVTLKDVIYFYRQNPNGISKQKAQIKCIDSYWITKYCLEEKKAREQDLGQYELMQFLLQVIRNQRRIKDLSKEIQEYVFIAENVLYKSYFQGVIPTKKSFILLLESLKRKSFSAFQLLYDNWDLLSEE